MAQIMAIDGIQTEQRFAVADNAYLMICTRNSWSNERTVKTKKREDAVSNEPALPLFDNVISVTTTANTARLKGTKTLIESPEYEAIRSLDTRSRIWLVTNKGFNSEIDGALWIPKGLRVDIEAYMHSYASKRAELVDAFIAAYPSQVAAAQLEQTGLGNLWNASDYPSPETLRSRFRLTWRYVTYGVPDDLRVVDPLAYEEEKRKEREQAMSQMDDIMATMRTSFAALVDKMADALTPTPDGKEKRFFGSNLTHLQDFLKDFNARNICNDTQLAQLAERASAMLDGVTPEGIKSNAEFKTRLLSRMDSLGSQLGDLVQAVPSRRMRKAGSYSAPSPSVQTETATEDTSAA